MCVCICMCVFIVFLANLPMCLCVRVYVWWVCFTYAWVRSYMHMCTGASNRALCAHVSVCMCVCVCVCTNIFWNFVLRTQSLLHKIMCIEHFLIVTFNMVHTMSHAMSFFSLLFFINCCAYNLGQIFKKINISLKCQVCSSMT